MTSLKSNLVKRIDRLPKPANATGALQPLFEAISNAIHATQARFGESTPQKGKVTVTVSTNRKKENVTASVKDNGDGLNKANWDAFTTTDTDSKISIGGKGVGRLLWLDCFENIAVESIFQEDNTHKHRTFKFVLSQENQIQDNSVETTQHPSDTMFHVKFENLRTNGYHQKFPGCGDYIFQHITSHFLPVFIGGRSPRVSVHIADETREYPRAIEDIVHRREPETRIETPDYGVLRLTLMECNKVASSDLKGSHFVHFIAHDRTVHSQAIDGKLGLKYFGENEDRVFHAILTGDFLDKNVNQERTAFTFEDAIIGKIVNEFCTPHIEKFLAEPLNELKNKQLEIIESITATYPSVAFGSSEELQDEIPSGDLENDSIYGHLARERFRRDERQAERIRGVLKNLKGGVGDENALSSKIAEASRELENAEQRSLAEYVVRRKVVLDFIEILLEKIRDSEADSAYQREETLHSFICPIRVDHTSEKCSATSHDLWVIDERLTFAEYFSSDVSFESLSDQFKSKERPDLLIFDRVHGLRQGNESSQILLVEFKRPGREDYDNNENPQQQVEKYVKRLQEGKLKDVRGRPIRIDQSTVFYCYIVADIVGKMEDWTYSWQKTSDGRGRIYRPSGGFQGSIEIIEWDALVKDAQSRNEAFFDRVGISGKSFFGID